MPTVHYRHDPGNPRELTPEEKARLDAMTPEEIEQNAIDDPDNPPSTDEELLRGVTGRRVRLLRQARALTHAEMARRYRLDLDWLVEMERGSIDPDPAFLAYLTVIEREPAAVERALAAEEASASRIAV